jgi:hypothetical protein
MNENPRGVLPLAVLCVAFFPATVVADGGSVRAYEQVGNYTIAVFTSPTPFRAGPVDISVLVQDAATGEALPAARVNLCLTARGSGEVLEVAATAEAATNKLFRAAVFTLPEPGWWDVAIAIEGPHGPARVEFAMPAEEPLPRWLTLWPWFCWPALAVLLFGIHQALVRRKHRAAVALGTARDTGESGL